MGESTGTVHGNLVPPNTPLSEVQDIADADAWFLYAIQSLDPKTVQRVRMCQITAKERAASPALDLACAARAKHDEYAHGAIGLP